MKGVLRVSKEPVIEIERYCDEHWITRKQRIKELGLMQAASMPVGKSRFKQASVQMELMTIEVRTSSGAVWCCTQGKHITEQAQSYAESEEHQ